MKRVITVAVASVLFTSANVNAHVSDAEWAEFKAKFEAMSNRVNALESENQQLREGTVKVEDLAATNAEVATIKEQGVASAWADKIKVKGDFRYRYEDIEQEGKSDRNRNRIRARAAVIAKPANDLEVGLGVASGGDDPLSTNQTLGGGGTSKGLNLDLAYAKWTGMENAYLMAGKSANPFYKVQKSGLIWDGDYRPEGFAAGWANDMMFATASYSFIESDSKNDDDGIFGLQVGAKFDLADAARLTASAAYLDIPTKGREAIYDGDFFGNSTVMVNGAEVYAIDYKILNASVEVALSIADMPFSIYGDFIKNDEASDFDTGYLLGVKLGKAKSKGTWQVQYQYQDLEADATLGQLTDSDFAGGGTDGEGHKLSAKYALGSKWTVGATYFDNNAGVDLGSDADYQRLQLDTVFKY